MSHWLDRDLQRKILHFLLPVYPKMLNIRDFAQVLIPGVKIPPALNIVGGQGITRCSEMVPDEHDFSKLHKNIYYLNELGLISIKSYFKGDTVGLECSINNRGIDFLEDDGGLTAKLRVMTVKLHADTIKALIQYKIDNSDVSESEKSVLKSTLSKIGDAALATLTEKAIEAVPIAYFFSVLKSLGNG